MQLRKEPAKDKLILYWFWPIEVDKHKIGFENSLLPNILMLMWATNTKTHFERLSGVAIESILMIPQCGCSLSPTMIPLVLV